jgi:hypothetical protein
MSNADHLEIDAQTKKTNHTLEDMLINFVGHIQVTWEQYLFLMEFNYNVSWHSFIKTNPFYGLYGQECLIPFSISTPSFKVEGINLMITTMQHTLTLVKKSMKSVQIGLNFTRIKIIPLKNLR